LIVEFSVESPPYFVPAIELAPGPEGQDKIILASPWLAGIPVDEAQQDRMTKDLAHAVTFVTAARSIQYTSKRALTPLQRALLDEYAAWYASGRDARLVLLQPLVAERGWDAMPEALRLARESVTMNEYLERWANLPASEVQASPERAAAYFEGLLNLERAALLLGRKETFLMFQDAAWRDAQERYFWLVQENPAIAQGRYLGAQPAQVSGDRARVQFVQTLASVEGLPPQSLGSLVFLRQQDGGWRHANVLDGYSWSFPPLALTLTPTPAPTPTPGRSSD
jgi:hypothetical protein